MAFQNQIVYAVTKTPNLWSELSDDICYARVYHYRYRVEEGEGPDMNRRYVLTAYRVPNDFSVNLANWWVINLLRSMPRAMRRGFTIKRITPNAKKGLQSHYPHGKPWAQASFDGAVMSGTEIYALLSLFRYPQEQPHIVKYTREIMRKYGLSFSSAFLVAGTNDAHGGHGMITASTFVGMKEKSEVEGRNIIMQYDLSDVFGKLITSRVEHRPFVHNPTKVTTSAYFVPKGLDYYGWGSGVVGWAPPGKYDKDYVPTPEGAYSVYWLNKFNIKPKEV